VSTGILLGSDSDLSLDCGSFITGH
jgi:hypothetical protein